MFSLSFPDSHHQLTSSLDRLRDLLKQPRTSSLAREVLSLVSLLEARDSYDGVLELVRERIEALHGGEEGGVRGVPGLVAAQPKDDQAGVTAIFQVTTLLEGHLK